MSLFQNILVGIDLAPCERLDIDALTPIAQHVFKQSLWLARQTSGALTFLTALNLTDEVLLILEEQHRLVLTRKIEAEAQQVLAELVRRAQAQGVPATSVFTHGKGWHELTCQVLRGQHDLVLVGTHDAASWRKILLGNTAIKLLRRCPCPVWVSRPEPVDRPLNILVATDLRPVSENALHLAVSLAKATGSALHVLHVLDYPLYHLWLTAIPDEVGPAYHHKLRDHAEHTIREHLEQTDYRGLTIPVQVHVADRAGQPDAVILQALEQHHIDLLVLGTIGRGGLPGITIGNTAERLLPEVNCSVLTVKPPDFHCPVRLP